jgi:hypothetical protein
MASHKSLWIAGTACRLIAALNFSLKGMTFFSCASNELLASTCETLRTLGGLPPAVDGFAGNSAVSGLLFIRADELELILLSDMVLALGLIKGGTEQRNKDWREN